MNLDRTPAETGAPDPEAAATRLRFDLAIDAAGIGSFDWDLGTGRLEWDDRMLEIFGYDRVSWPGTIEAFAERLHPDDATRTLEALRHAIDTQGEYDAEFRVVLPTGETRWVQGRGRALADEAGTSVRLLGAGYDTTEHRHADARVARVLESMNAAFFALDQDWRFTYVNGEAERVLQRSRGDLLGGDIWELFPAAVGSDFEVHYRGAAATGRERVFEAYYPAPLDAWYEVRAWPGPDGLSVYFLDVSERRAAEERARDKQEFAAACGEFAEDHFLRAYSLVGTRGDCDLMIRAVAPSLDSIHELHVLLNQSGLMRWAEVPHSYLAMTKLSPYTDQPDTPLEPRPGAEARYLIVYPMWKKREWYRLEADERMRVMRDHIAVARRFTGIETNTAYSFGLDDQEFVVAFETDEPADFLDLVMELRETRASEYTLRDTPIFTCVQMAPGEALDMLATAP